MSRRRDEMIQAFGDAVREMQRATDAVDEAVAAKMGVNRTDAKCLDIVLQYGGVTAGELAERSGMSPAATTTVIDRLERAGWVERSRDEVDRRRVLVRATPACERFSQEIFGPIVQDMEHAFDGYSDADVALLYEWIRASERYQTQLAAWIRGEGELPTFAGVRKPAEPGPLAD
jgi:DNA-binding MarR family transcriptional regulator